MLVFVTLATAATATTAKRQGMAQQQDYWHDDCITSQDEIVYGTQTQQSPSVGFGEALSMTQESRHMEVTTTRTNMIPRRRRSLAKQRQYQQQYDGTDDGYSQDNNPTPASTTKDNFASLAAFLELESNNVRCHAATNGTSATFPILTALDLPEPQFESRPLAAVENHECTAMENSTQNDFPFHNDNDDGDDDVNDSLTETGGRESSTAEKMRNITNYTTIRKHHQHHPDSWLLDIAARRRISAKKRSPINTTANADFQQSLLSELEKSRKRSRNNDSWSGHLSGFEGKATNQTLSSSPSRQVSTYKGVSIRDSRPTHWRTRNDARGITRAISHPAITSLPDTTSRTKKLSEATKRSFLAIKQNPKPFRKKATILAATGVGPLLSFVPAFIGLSKSDSVGHIECTQSYLKLVPPPCSTPNFVSPKTKKKSRIQAGPLLQTLRKIRAAVDGDVVRLQSGMYPLGTTDMNDPRHRASSHITITILGSLVPCKNEQIWTALARVHNDNNNNINSNTTAYVTFSYATARTHKLMEGSQLCIYNPIVCPGSRTNHGGEPSIVLGTQLCEQAVMLP